MQGFELYVLVSKALVPWYDERFTGYLEDKVVHIQHMVHMGFSFAVHPEVFVVHYRHEDSKDQGLVKATGLMQQVTYSLTHSLAHTLASHSLTHSQKGARLLKDAVMCTVLPMLLCGSDTNHEGCMRHM